jgi:prophage regulatory protein
LFSLLRELFINHLLRADAMYKNELNYDPVMRMPDVQRMTGLSRSSIYRLISLGVFPSAIKLSSLAVGWRRSSVNDWLLQRAPARRASQIVQASSGQIGSK